ncbi:NAD(P)-dependent dehydrogenase (short-subunit alcohol dehydrogenase family) [Cryobacterium sp. MP_M5]|uniref:SDR family NAD(P)-dependent oxidoreductase n=1 Tax=unclassified Cryobacterium TaxID=2649013 RepID=UPI0018C99715|nr:MULTISPECIES: SDR family oxidoreductase [unclassified Cryobacterium]MBG6059169.1 NAD(P)-dependent dehydrogenase (short-subunit alcohol dehydrogenase family) [Cryobacterium sp. MP_M3]MEC5177463.1 NAD(P)-dependent dehydrogenase (short-subunit alcohol dehydrogenase family) [Cryobacterium sp. MP_M5]
MPEPRTAPTSPRTVLITGAAGGLGRAFALGFAAQGDRVVVADVNLDGCRETVSLIEAVGGTALAVGVDVTALDSATAMAEEAARWSSLSKPGGEHCGDGKIDVVINNAAIYATVTRAPFTELDPDEWDRVMAVNLKGPWLVTRACSPYLPDGGKVINLSSATVMSGSAQWAHYVASKGGVIALTRVLAKELGDRNITVNAIAPGFTLTEASYGLIDGAEQYGVDRGALKRASEPEDIVGAALFLAGPGSNYITGQTLVVDGGRQFI